MRLDEIDPARNVQCGDTLLNAGALTMHVGSRQCELTASEFRLLQILFARPNLLLPKGVVMDALFEGQEQRPAEGGLRVYVHRVRARLRDLKSNLSISTRHGLGWVLVTPVEPAQPDPDESSAVQRHSDAMSGTGLQPLFD